MKRTKYFQTRLRQQTLYHVGIVICFICVSWISIDSTLAAAVAVEDKVTSPSRNEATNPLKEPTPSTLQGTFLNNNNLTDANNGSTSTPPADASGRRRNVAVSTTTAQTANIWAVRTTTAAPPPADNESATTDANRPLESWQNVVHTSSEEPSSTPGTPPPPPPPTDVSGGDYGPTGPDADLNDKNLMAKMLKSWFNENDKDNGETAAAKGYYRLAAEYLRKSDEPSGAASEAGTTSKTGAATVGGSGSSKNLFERWDEASEEQERVLEDTMRSERPDDGVSSASASSVLAADQNTPSRWFVLLLTGNSTVAQMRRTDFAKYLKLNLAARLSLEYDEVKINRVLVVPPRLMVNVSVVPVSERGAAAAAAAAASASSSSASAFASASALDSNRVEDEDPLHNLVETNATLMELSGEEYRVERFMSLKSQKPQSLEEAGAVVSDRHADIDYFIYATVGPLCFVVVLGFLLLTLYKYVRKHPVQWPWKRKMRAPSFWPSAADHQHRHRRMTDEFADGGRGGSAVDEMMSCGGSVNVIYSGEFEQSQQQQLSGSWLDDASFVPDDSLDRIRTPTLLRPAARHHRQQQRGGSDDDPRPMSLLDNVQCGAATAVHHRAVQSPRLSRENKLRILGCKHECLLLPAVQPAAAVSPLAAPARQRDHEDPDDAVSAPPQPPPPPQHQWTAHRTATDDDGLQCPST